MNGIRISYSSFVGFLYFEIRVMMSDTLGKENDEYLDRIREYENKNALDKTFDAVDSWIDMFN